MLPPTVVTCRELSTLSATEVLAAAAERDIRPIEPRFVQQDGQWWLDIDREEDCDRTPANELRAPRAGFPYRRLLSGGRHERAVTERASFVLADNPGHHDARRHQHVDPARARLAAVGRGRPGPRSRGARRRRRGRGGRGRTGAVHPPPRGPHRRASGRSSTATGAPTRAISPEFCRDADPLVDGERIEVDGLLIDVVAAPGHTPDSVASVLPQEPCAAQRRHGARPWHHRGRPSRRRPRPLPGLTAPGSASW